MKSDESQPDRKRYAKWKIMTQVRLEGRDDTPQRRSQDGWVSLPGKQCPITQSEEADFGGANNGNELKWEKISQRGPGSVISNSRSWS